MQLGAIQSTIAADFRKHDGVSRKEDAKSSVYANKKTDKASISSESRSAAQTASTAKALSARVESQPDIRLDKVENVREKVNSGYYNSQEFAGNLADRLIRDFGF